MMEETYESIYRACFPKLVIFLQHHISCNLQDAEDIASRAMQILWEKWDTLPTHTEVGLTSWLFRTARNLARDHEKSLSRRPPTLSLDELPPSRAPQAEQEESPEQYDRYLSRILQRLSPDDAALFADRIIRHQTDKQIAARMGITVNAVRIRWTRIKQKIRAFWQEIVDSDE